MLKLPTHSGFHDLFLKIKELKQHDAAILLKIRQPKVCLLMNLRMKGPGIGIFLKTL
jgi:predicted XRE-type DNA-binding protein